MKVLLDTSVVVAGSIADHPHEQRARVWLDAARSGAIDARVTTHALAETWATLTALPIEPPVAPATALRIVERFADGVTPLALEWGDYRNALARCTDRGLRSGAIYDALHLAAAERWAADVLLTFNTRDFTRFTGPESPEILAPPDPPGIPPQNSTL